MHNVNKVTFTKSALAVSILIGLSGSAVAATGVNYDKLDPPNGTGADNSIQAWTLDNKENTVTLSSEDAQEKDRKGNIYFNPAPVESPNRTVNVLGFNLDDHYINVSKNNNNIDNSVSTVSLTKSSVDYIEAGSKDKNTNIAINLQDSTLNGAEIDRNYDNAPEVNGKKKNKNWVAGYGIYVDGGDTGNVDISIADSQLGSETRHAGIFTGGAEQANIKVDNTMVTGNIEGRYKAHDIASTKNMDVVIDNGSTVNGSINTGKGIANVTVTGGSKVIGNIDLTTSSEGSVLLGDDAATSSVTALIGSKAVGASSKVVLDEGVTTLDGNKFSGFSALQVTGTTAITGGFNDANVGNALGVISDKSGIVTADVKLTNGNLSVDNATLKADVISLGDNASLNVKKGTLQTGSTQLFNAALDAKGQTASANGFNANGKKTTFKDSTLVLTDALYNLDYVQSVNDLLQKSAKLVMLGQFTPVNGKEPSGDVNLNALAQTDLSQMVLANVTAKADSSQVEIGGTGADTGAIAHGISVKSLQLAKGSAPSVTVKGKQTLALMGDYTGNENAELIATEDGSTASVNIADANSTLQLGHESLTNGTGRLNANVTLGQDTKMRVAGGVYSVTGSEGIQANQGSQVTVDHGSALTSGKVSLSDAAMDVKGVLNTDNFTATENSIINVGTDTAAGHLSANNVSLNGATVFLDPVWQDGSTIGQASQAALKFTHDQVNGALVVGQNSLLTLGNTSSQWAIAEFANSELTWSANAVTAAVAIEAPQTLSATNGGLRVEGSLTTGGTNNTVANNNAVFGDNSLLMVNGDAVTQGNYALSSAAGTLSVNDSAKLYISNAKNNQAYNIVDGFTDASSNVAANGWNGDNLLTNSMLVATRTWDAALGQMTVTTVAKAAADTLPGVALPHVLDTMVAQGLNDTNSASAGIQFLSRAIDTPNVSTQNIVKAVNSASQLAVAGAVQNTTLATGMSAVNAVLDHNSVLNGREEGVNLWVNRLYGNNQNRDFSAGSLKTGNSLNFSGLLMGVDITHDIGMGSLRSGFAFNAGNGRSSSKGDFNYTKNEADFLGGFFYENWSRNNVNLTADLGYSKNSNSVEQNLPSYINMGDKLKADIDSQMLTAGVTGEYVISTSVLDIVPHIGVRYAQLTTKNFDTKAAGSSLFNTAEEKQNLWQFPVGVRLNKTFALDSGWNISPQANLSVIQVTGDSKANTNVRAYGINASDNITARVVDDTSFAGQFGVKTQKGNVSVGINYYINASQHQTGQGVMATFSYSLNY